MNKKQHLMIGLLAFFCVIMGFSACGKKSGDNTVVLRVGGETVTLGELKDQLKNTPASYHEYLNTEQGRQQFFDIMSRQKIIIAAARKNGVDKKPDVVEAVKEFKADYLNKVKQYEEELIMREYLKDIENKVVNVTNDEMTVYYNENRKELDHLKEYSLSHILVGTENEAKEVISRLNSGGSFQKLAKEVSLDPDTKNTGGALGKFKYYELLPEFQGPIESVGVGQVVPKPVSTVYGFHVLKKTGERVVPSETQAIQQDIKKILLKKKFDKWMDDQKKVFKVEINNEAFKQLWK